MPTRRRGLMAIMKAAAAVVLDGAVFRAAGTYKTFGTTTSLTLAAPANMVAGDYVRLYFVLSPTRTISSVTGLNSATALVAGTSFGAGSSTAEFIYGGFWDGKSTSFVISWTGAAGTSTEGMAMAYSAVDPSTPEDFTRVIGTPATSGTTATAPSATTVTANTLIQAVLGADPDFATGATAPSGYTKRSAGSGITFLIADKLQAAIGATSTASGTYSASGNSLGVMMGLRPAAIYVVGAAVGAAETANATTHTIVIPTVRDGDTLILDSTAASSTTQTANGGPIVNATANALINIAQSGVGAHKWVYPLLASHSGQTITITTGASLKTSATITVIRGLHPTSPLGTAVSSTGATSATPTGPTAPTPTSSTITLTTLYLGTGTTAPPTVWTPGTGMTLAGNVGTGGTTGRAAIAAAINVVPGATVGTSWVINNSGTYVAAAVTLNLP